MTETPEIGDVLITTEGGRHLLSIVPYPHRLSMSRYELAFSIARRWADENNVNIWLTANGEITKLPSG